MQFKILYSIRNFIVYGIFPVFFLYLVSCQSPRNNRNQTEQPKEDPVEKSFIETWEKKNFRNFQFTLKYPRDWEQREFTVGQEQHVINLFPADVLDSLDLPVTIHAKADVSFIGIYPNGYGTELPMGKSISLNQYNDLQLNFSADMIESKVFLLENNQAWGYFIVPSSPPAGWGTHGFVFAQAAVDDFQVKCFDKETGRELDMKECDPMMGDTIRRFGNIDSRQKQIINGILGSVNFTGNNNDGGAGAASEIRVNQPEKGTAVNSPINISGSARGSWYFEAQFTVQLRQNNQMISKAIVSADGDWMTDDFVPFTASLEYPSDYEGKAELVFQNSNASGKPELDKEYRLPVFLK